MRSICIDLVLEAGIPWPDGEEARPGTITYSHNAGCANGSVSGLEYSGEKKGRRNKEEEKDVGCSPRSP